MLSICFILFLLISILSSSYSQVTCASGWVQNGGKCYSVMPAFNSGSTTGTWLQCNLYCPTSYPGATMFCVRNAAENDWISIQYPGNYKWIGYTDMPPYGGGKGTKQYGWVTGCISTFTSWYPNQPDNAGNNEDYVQVNGNGQWNDQTPEATYPCGCQYTPTTLTPSSTPTHAPSSTPSSGSTVAPSSGPSIAQSSSPTSTPSSSPTSTPTTTPSSGAITE